MAALAQAVLCIKIYILYSKRIQAKAAILNVQNVNHSKTELQNVPFLNGFRIRAPTVVHGVNTGLGWLKGRSMSGTDGCKNFETHRCCCCTATLPVWARKYAAVVAAAAVDAA